MSFFRAPITNKVPEKKFWTLWTVYNYVRSEQAKPQTEALRQIAEHAAQRSYKSANFDYVTPGGTFSYCADNCLLEASGLVCMDLDYLGDRVEEMFSVLLSDPMFATLLLFRSPTGNGLKWFVEVDLTKCDFKTWYSAIRNYLMNTYSLSDDQVDKHCGNISRACYLGYDPAAYINPALVPTPAPQSKRGWGKAFNSFLILFLIYLYHG